MRLNNEIAENNAYLESLKNEESDLLTQSEKLTAVIADRGRIEEKISQLAHYHAKIEHKQQQASIDYQFYHANDNCPTCKQEITEAFKKNAIVLANCKTQELSEALKKLDAEMSKLDSQLKEIQRTMKEYQSIQAEINKLNVSRKHVNAAIQKSLTEINSLQEKKILSEDMMKVSEELVNRLVEQNANHRTLIENRAYYEIAVGFLKDDALKAEIIKQYLPVINMHVNKYLAAMDFFVNFELNGEFVESIKSRHRDTFTYDSFSEGEKQKIDIALLFAWRAVAKLKNSVNTNLLILDEIFDSSLDGT